jgi:pimeloyl-ACP methyl ester carboxylesterase
VQESWAAQVEGGVALAAGLVGERAGEPALADAGRSDEEDVEVLGDASAGVEPWGIDLDALTVPVRLVYGGHDTVTPPGSARRPRRLGAPLFGLAIRDGLSSPGAPSAQRHERHP